MEDFHVDQGFLFLFVRFTNKEYAHFENGNSFQEISSVDVEACIIPLDSDQTVEKLCLKLSAVRLHVAFLCNQIYPRI